MSESDWAETKAREWLKTMRLTPRYYIPSLAALLREDREAVLAEVRRVVAEVRADERQSPKTADEILRRLESL